VGGIVDIGTVQEYEILIGGSAADVESHRKVRKRRDSGQGLDCSNRVGFDGRWRRLELLDLQNGSPGADVEALDLFPFRLDDHRLQLDRFFQEEQVEHQVAGAQLDLFLEGLVADHRRRQRVASRRNPRYGVVATLVADAAVLLSLQIYTDERQAFTVTLVAYEAADVGRV
jgi:hypothetical protein